MAPTAVSRSSQQARGKHGKFTRQPLPKPATMQLQTQAIPKTTVSQHMTVETSVQLVQTLTQACVSSLAKLRHMFDDNNYEPRQINVSDSTDSGEGKSRNESPKPPVLLQFSSLKRGVTSRADRLLDWVENGAGDAIERGYLKAMRFAIYEDENCPDDRLEEWVLSFTYHTDNITGKHIVTNMSLAEKVQDKTITISQARRALGRFIADLAHVCTECLPDLPATVRLLVELDMNERRPLDYCPAGFGSYVADSPRFANTEDWECQTRSIAKMRAGYHDVKLQVNYLAPRHDDVSSVVPSGIPCTKSLSVAAVTQAQVPTMGRSPPHSGGQPNLNTVSADRSVASRDRINPSSNNAEVSSTADNEASKPARSYEKQPVRDVYSDETVAALMRHSSDDLRVRDQIGRMLPPSTNNTTLPETQTRDPVKPTENASDCSPIVISHARIEELVTRNFPKPPPRHESTIIRADQMMDQVIAVECECGCQDKEGNMICCSFCEKYQHVHCLGYNGDNEGRVPRTHVCYRCLLAGETPHQLNTIREISLCRRAIHRLQVKVYDSIRELAKDLALKEAVCSKIIKRLKQSGVLATSAHSRYSIALDTSPTGKANLDKSYFDPTEGISHHLEESSQMGVQYMSTRNTGKVQRKRSNEDTGHTNGPPTKVFGSSFRPSEGIRTGEYMTPKAAKRQREGGRA